MLNVIEITKKARRTFNQVSMFLVVLTFFSGNCFAAKAKFFKISASKVVENYNANVDNTYTAHFGKAAVELTFNNEKLEDQLEMIKYKSKKKEADYVLKGYFTLKNKKTIFVATNIRIKVADISY